MMLRATSIGPTHGFGAPVNLETDIIGKYVERLLQPMKTEEERNTVGKRNPETEQETSADRQGITPETRTCPPASS